MESAIMTDAGRLVQTWSKSVVQPKEEALATAPVTYS